MGEFGDLFTVVDRKSNLYQRKENNLGVQRVLYTDVGRDGTLGGPNVETTAAVARILSVLASGGVSTVEHLRALAEAGAEGAIIGTALYNGTLRLEEALAAC